MTRRSAGAHVARAEGMLLRGRSGVAGALLLSLSAFAFACGPSEARKAAVRGELTKLAHDVENRVYAREVPRGQSKLPGAFGEAFDGRKVERAVVVQSADAATKCLELTARTGETQEPAADPCPELEGSRPALEALLDLGRSERPGIPPSAHPFLHTKETAETQRSFVALCKRAAAEVAADVQRGRPAVAALTCTRAVEVARDYMLGGSVADAVFAASCSEVLDAPCGRAVDALPAAERAPLGTALEAVASSVPTFADMLDIEIAFVSLGACSSILGPADRERLGPRAQALVASSDVSLFGRERARAETVCVDGFEAMQLVASAYRHPAGSPERASVLAKRKQTPLSVLEIDYEKVDTRISEMPSRIRALARR